MAVLWRMGVLAGGLLVVAGVPGAAPRAARLPAIVFVSRVPLADPLAIPGLGPSHRAAAAGGRLLVREADGRVRDVLPEGALFDVSDPSVSFDARWIAFAGLPHPDSGWRIYRAPAAGGAPLPITHGPAGAPRFDDLDPCWVGETRVCFASTRGGERAQYGAVPVTNLYQVEIEGGAVRRLTAERNGAEEPAYDLETGGIVYTRWWFNRHRPSRDASGITADPARAIPQDSVNLWQAVEIALDGSGLRLAAGHVRSRAGTMAYQPAQLADGSWCGVFAGNTGLFPGPAGVGIQIFPGRYGASLRLAGPLLAERPADAYGTARGLASPSACAPAGLPDGRIVAAYDPGGRGDFGIVTLDPADARIERVFDLEGRLELDPAPLVPLAARRPAQAKEAGALPAPGGSRGADSTFTYECRNVFAQGPVDSPVPDGPLLARDLVLRFFRVAPGSEGPGLDSAVLIRETPLAPDGSIRAEGLPAWTPLFEQLVDARRGVVLAAHGPAHVAGLNYAPPGTTARCVGCHLGHSVLPAGALDDPGAAAWFNASPSAAVSASSVLPGTAGAIAAVDRRTRGAPEKVAWIANGGAGEALRLAWAVPLEIREVVLYPLSRGGPGAGSCTVRLWRDGAEVARARRGALAPDGERFAFDGRTADAIEIQIESVRGRTLGQRVAALAEVETVARVPR